MTKHIHVFRAVGRCAPSPDGSRLVAVLRSGGAEACAGAIDVLVERGRAAAGADKVAAYLRRHAAEIGGGPSMGTMEAEQQHMYKVRMGSFPCAWSPEGADAMARLARVGVRAASPHPRVGAVPATPGAAGAQAREAPCPAGGRARKIRGEGLGVPAHRLPRGLQGRRPLRGGRRPAGVVTNICFMPSGRYLKP